jgi:hypothetical protein
LAIVTVTWPLAYLSATPVRFVEIYLAPRASGAIRVESTVAVARSSGRTAVMDFYAQTDDPGIARVVVQLRKSTSSAFVDAATFDVDRGVIRGVLQLGSPASPVGAHEVYSFRVVAHPSNDIDAEGQLVVVMTTVAGAGQTVILTIGLMASLIQILESTARWYYATRSPSDSSEEISETTDAVG